MKYNFLIFTFIFINIDIIKCILKLSFKKEKPNEINENNFFYYITENIYISNIKVGSPYQEIPIQIKFSINEFMIIPKEKKGYFQLNNSKTLHQLEKDFEQDFNSQFFNKGILCWDNMLFENNIKITNLTFILGTNILKELKGGVLGLRKKTLNNLSDTISFIYLIKKRNLINSYSFHFIFNKENNGEIIIGNYPHEYNNEIFDKENLKNIYVKKNNDFIYWNVKFNNIKFGNKDLNYDLNIQFNADLGGIIASENIFDFFINNFFNELILKNLCKIFYSSNKWYKGFYCDNNINIENFSNLYFYHKELNYTFNLNYNDLFIKEKDKLFFLIIFKHDSTDFFWEFGEVFFKKYQIIFDEEKGIIGFYNLKKIKAFNYSLLFIFLLIILVILLISVIIRMIIIKPRKLRANELEDNYDYIQKIN